MKITTPRPTSTLTEGKLTIEDSSLTLAVGGMTLRISERADGAVAVYGDATYRANSDGEMILEPYRKLSAEEVR